MSRKAVLIMDMPESCGSCDFRFPIGGSYCTRLKRPLQNYNKEECPLKELPEKKKHNEHIFDEADNHYNEGHARGWNDFRDVLLR